MKNYYLTIVSSVSSFFERVGFYTKSGLLFILFSVISLAGFTQNLTQSGFTGVTVPQFMASGTASRMPLMFRATVSGLTASTSYRFYTQGATNSTTGGGTVDFGTANSGAGNPLLINSTGTTFSYSTAPGLSTAGTFETFTTDATGSYTGWFGFVNTGNARFTAGNTVFPTIVLNAGGTATVVNKRLALDIGIKVLAFGGAGANNGSLLQSISTNATAKNLVAVYDNIGGTGRPLSVSVIESVGVTIASLPTTYNVTAGSWNSIVPNTNTNGVRRIEQRGVTNNNLIGCANDEDGVWATGSINTVNPTSGTTAIAISATDAPLNVCPIAVAPVINSSLTATGTVGTAISSYTITALNSPTTFTASNLPTGLTFTSPTISGTPTNAGTFNTTISATNTTGSDTKTLVFTITKGNQIISGFPSTNTKTYGDADYTLSASSNSGLAVSYLSSNTNVATIAGNTVTIIGNGTTTITASQAGDANYNAATNIDQTLTINQKTLTITTPSIPNKVYDRTNTATITGTLSGIIGSDVVTFNGTGTFSQVTVGSGLAVTSTSILNGADAAKYTLTQPTGLTGQIVVKPLTVTGATVANKEYDGTSTAIITGTTLNGIISQDVVTVSGGGNFSSVNVGNAVDVTGALSLSGADASNYVILQPTLLSANITAKPLDISRLVVGNKVFDGNINAILSGSPTLNGIVTGEESNVILGGTPTATFDNRNIGTAKPIMVAGYSLNGSQSGNYTVLQPNGLTANITPLALSLNSAIAQNKPFDGNTNAVITGTLTGIISPDMVTLVGTGTFASSAIGDGIAVTSTSTLSGAGAGNYTLTQPIGLTADITGPPTIVINVATTSNYIDGGILTSPISPYSLSGVINDPTDPSKTLGIDFTVNDVSVPADNLIVTVTSSNTNVVPTTNLNLTGSGNSRNLKITPIAEGFSTIVVNVNNGSSTASYSVNYASSNASISPSTTRFHTGTADASTAQMIDNDLMIVADDENQALRLYNRQNSGLPLNSFNFTTSLGLTDISGGNPREVDIEASAKVGNRIYWMGSHSNASSGNNRPNRSRFFATDISGTGNATTLSYVGRFDNLKSNLLAWDANNGHGLGANFLGLAASTVVGKAPETADGSGFNIEGFEIAPNNTTAYICFRAPLQTTTTRTKALIIPLTNFADLVSGNPTSTTATFGNPIQLDLGGRAIREMKKNSTGEYLIIAGPHDNSTGIAPKDFRFYTWTGNPSDAPILRSANLTALNTNGSFESIVDLPNPLLSTSNIQVLVDNGDAIFYGNGVIAKELPQNNHKKFRSELINLGTESLPLATIKSITTGNWESTTTWNLGRIPQAGDLVIIDQNHEVTLNGTGNIKQIEYQGTGKLKLNSSLSSLKTGL